MNCDETSVLMHALIDGASRMLRSSVGSPSSHRGRGQLALTRSRQQNSHNKRTELTLVRARPDLVCENKVIGSRGS